jgi:hypothetical protein
MKNTTKRVQLDWSKLLAFNQVRTAPARNASRPMKSPAMTMIGDKGTT